MECSDKRAIDGSTQETLGGKINLPILQVILVSKQLSFYQLLAAGVTNWGKFFVESRRKISVTNYFLKSQKYQNYFNNHILLLAVQAKKDMIPEG